MPDNVRRGQPQGKCHRKQTAPPAFSSPVHTDGNAGGVRVKGWGKSPPRLWQQRRHGKPHQEQDRIGMTRGASPGLFPGWSSGLVARGHAQARPQRNGCRVPPLRRRGHTEPGLQAGWQFTDRSAAENARRPPDGLGRSATAADRPGVKHLLTIIGAQYRLCTRGDEASFPLTPNLSHVIPKRSLGVVKRSPVAGAFRTE